MPKWIVIGYEMHRYAPGLFMILSWISYTEKKKPLHVFFFILGLLDIYLTLKNAVAPETGEDVALLIGYILMMVVFLLIPFIYRTYVKKRWQFYTLNVVIFLAAAHREIIEAVKVFVWFHKAGINLLKVPVVMYMKLWSDINCLTIVSEPVYEIIINFKNIFCPEITEIEILPDYFWFLRIFLFAAILFWNIYWGYERRNGVIEEKLCQKNKSHKKTISTILFSLFAILYLSVDIYIYKYVWPVYYQKSMEILIKYGTPD